MDEKNTNTAGNENLNNSTKDMSDQSLNECNKQLQVSEERYHRLSADFDNYRRRADRERAKIVWEARARVLRGALELVDTIDRAAESLHDQKTKLEGHESVVQALQGVELLKKAASRFLEQHNVKVIDQIKQFDPTLHEAISYGQDAQYSPGDVLEVFEKGYLLDGELLRPARVRVNGEAL